MSLFEIVESDIAVLHGDQGWVNVGAHAIRITNHGGNLQVEAFANTNEDDALAWLRVNKETAVNAGGQGPDELGQAFEETFHAS
jgi:hypothetical protein